MNKKKSICGDSGDSWPVWNRGISQPLLEYASTVWDQVMFMNVVEGLYNSLPVARHDVQNGAFCCINSLPTTVLSVVC